jgi:hypothetical protein
MAAAFHDPGSGSPAGHPASALTCRASNLILNRQSVKPQEAIGLAENFACGAFFAPAGDCVTMLAFYIDLVTIAP